MGGQLFYPQDPWNLIPPSDLLEGWAGEGQLLGSP